MRRYTTFVKTSLMRSVRLFLTSCIIVLAFLLSPATIQSSFAATVGNSSTSCVQPPANMDPDTLTDAQIALYGLPPRHPGMNHAAWKALVLSVKQHYCSWTSTSNQNSYQPWGGNIADQGGYNFASVYYNVPCIASGSQTGDSSFWVGIGGVNNGNVVHLVQTGTASQTSYFLGIQQYSYYAWVENTAASPSTEREVFGVSCGDRMYAEVSGGNHMFVEDITSGASSGDMSFGPNADSSTAECIAENPNYGAQPLADFRSVAFSSCDVGASGHGIGLDSHYYVNVTTSNGHVLTSVGAIQSNANYTVTWKASS